MRSVVRCLGIKERMKTTHQFGVLPFHPDALTFGLNRPAIRPKRQLVSLKTTLSEIHKLLFTCSQTGAKFTTLMQTSAANCPLIMRYL